MQTREFGPAWPAADGSALIVSLHGFPALRSQQNRVIAERLAEKLDRRVETPLYAGLGIAPGVFGFHSCLDAVCAYVRGRLRAAPEGRRDLDLLGHSWGGYMALALANDPVIAPRVRRLVLMSPLLRFGTSVEVRRDLLESVAESPLVNLGDLEVLAADFARLGRERPSENLVRQLPLGIDVFLLQASEDLVTPPEVATAMLAHFARPPRFEIAANDHGFTRDRLAVADHIASFFA